MECLIQILLQLYTLIRWALGIKVSQQVKEVTLAQATERLNADGELLHLLLCMDSSSIASTLFDRSKGTTAYVYPVS